MIDKSLGLVGNLTNMATNFQTHIHFKRHVQIFLLSIYSHTLVQSTRQQTPAYHLKQLTLSVSLSENSSHRYQVKSPPRQVAPRTSRPLFRSTRPLFRSTHPLFRTTRPLFRTTRPLTRTFRKTNFLCFVNVVFCYLSYVIQFLCCLIHVHFFSVLCCFLCT